MKGGIPAAVLTLMCAAFSCNREKPVAQVAGAKIMPGDFRERFESYISTTGEKDNILVREKIVNNMINEIAIEAEARERGFDADSAFRAKMESVASQALLDAYAKHISVDTIQVREKELWDEFRESNSRVNARFVYGRTEADARALKERLLKGETFSSLAKEVFTDPRLAASGGSLGYFGYGDMERNLEETAWWLPLGVLSDPVRLKEGWAIIRVDDRIEIPLASEIDFAARKPKLEKAVRERKILGSIRSASDSIAAELHPVFNDAAVELVLKNWSSITGTDEAGDALEQTRPLPPDETRTPLVSFRNQSWTIGDFVGKSASLSDRFRKRVRTAGDVRDVTVGLATREVLLSRATAAGLEQTDGVRTQIRRQKELYLLKRWEHAVVDTIVASSVSDDSIRAYFEANRESFVYPLQVDVAEILLKTPWEADSLARLVRKGADFAALARAHTVRPWAAAHGGELGYASRERYGALGDTLFHSRVGALVGPLEVGPYTGIFRILGRQESRPRTLEESRGDIINILLPLMKKRTYEQALVALRNRSLVSIDLEALGNVVIHRN